MLESNITKDTEVVAGEDNWFVNRSNQLTARGLFIIVGVLLLISVATTALAQLFGNVVVQEDINWNVYILFITRLLQRGPLAIAMIVLFGFMILVPQGLTSMKKIRDSDNISDAISIGFAVVGGLLATILITVL